MMLKKIISLLVAAALVLCILPVSALAADSVTWSYDTDGTLTISGSGAMTDYTAAAPAPWAEYANSITNLVIGSGVTSIGSEAFAGLNSLRTVSIPSTVTSIGDYAFYRCDTLTVVTIPANVTSIGSYAFYGCGDLTELTIPDSVTTIGEAAFASCEGLTSVTIGTAVSTIGSYAFHGCRGLTAVSIPASVTSIGDGAFQSCDNLTAIQVDGSNANYSSDASGILYDKDQSTLLRAPATFSGDFTIPGSVTAIEGYAFYGCTGLTSVNISGSVTTIGTEAFGECPALTGIWVDETNSSFSSDEYGVLYSKAKTVLHRVPATLSGSFVMPDTVRALANHAFDGCGNLTSITLSGSLTSIAESAFEGCAGLTAITIPEKVSALYPYAFYGCSGLAKLTIPGSVFAIAREALGACSALTGVRFIGSAPSFEPNVFYGVTATAEYPQYDSSWTSERMQNYGGSISWVSYHEHSYTSVTTEATCQEYAKTTYTCGTCGDTYTVYANDPTEWSTTKPTGVDEELIETKTQYRYSDYETTTSYETSLSGYEQVSSAWEQSGTGSVQYVKSWPSGFDTSNSLYTTYNKTPKTASETTTAKTTINSDVVSGYLYYHWCTGTQTDGPWNRTTTATKGGSYDTFCAFYSTTDPSTITDWDSSDYSYHYENGDCCMDSYWYFVTEVNTQKYTTYKALFTYGKWGEWSEWSDTAVTSTDTRKVETQTLYRYTDAELGDHNYVDGVCSVCGAADPNYNVNLDYYLVGFINGADYGCNDDYENLGEYKFEDGTLVVTFTEDSYVFVKASDNNHWYMTQSYVTTNSATLYNTSAGACEKMFVPGGVEVTFTLVDNGDDTFTLSYTTPEVAAAVITPKSATLSLEDEVLYNVYFVVENLNADAADMGLLMWDSEPADPTITGGGEQIEGAVYDSTSGRYMVTSSGIPAKKLSEDKYMVIYAKQADGSYVYSRVVNYSAQTYATKQLAKDTTSDSLKALCVALLNYGTAAQEYFEYRLDDLANADLTDEQKALVADYSSDMMSARGAVDDAKMGEFIATETGFAKKSVSVSLEGAFAINYYFTTSVAAENVKMYYWTQEDYEAATVLTAENCSGVADMAATANENQYWAEYAGIAAKNMDQKVYVCGVYEADGVTYSTGVIPYSLGYYFNSKATGSDTSLHPIAMATVVYGYYAKNYFAE